MTEKKRQILKMAHQLFMEKGFNSVSIQEIIDHCGISKGTFYNYFASKYDLFTDLLKMLFIQLRQDQNDLLVGQDPANMDIFIRQVELQVAMSRANRLNLLFEELAFSNDPRFKEFIRTNHLRMLRWYYRRFSDLFGENKKPYLLDCAIMFSGILHQNLKYYSMVCDSGAGIRRVVKYSVNRIAKIIQDVAETGEWLIRPELLEQWDPDCADGNRALRQQLRHAVLELKKLPPIQAHPPYGELLDFVLDELLHAGEPRKFLLDSALFTLKAATEQAGSGQTELQTLERLTTEYFARRTADSH